MRLELLYNVTAAYNYDESNRNAAEVADWNGVWIFKFSVGNYEALSSASHREGCDRSRTDY